MKRHVVVKASYIVLRWKIVRAFIVLAAVGAMLISWMEAADAAVGPRIDSAKYELSFDLPPGWQQQAATQGSKIVAVGPVSGSALPNLNIVVTSVVGAPTQRNFPQVAKPLVKRNLSAVGAKNARVAVVLSRLGYTVEGTYSLPNKSSTSPHLGGYQIYALHGDKIYIVTITSSGASSVRSIANVVKGSWQWK